MQEGTLFVVARIEPRIEIAFRHLRHVIFVQEFTLVAFFAETAEPMFTHNRAVTADMPEWAGGTLLAFGTICTVEELAYGRRRFYN